jgi:NTP pyrophosphatase (non-canonical NTP hydrolase)
MNAEPQGPLLETANLELALFKFAEDRDWAQFHSPKNLVMALTGEVGELSEIFQWMTEEQSKGAGRDPKTTQQVSDELADVMLYLVRLAAVLGVNLNDAVTNKLKLNASKYPAEVVRGSSEKYNANQNDKGTHADLRGEQKEIPQ